MFPVVFSHSATGWLTLLGLAVPLAIYLWNRRPGRVVRVGSVRWLEAAANRRLRSLRPEQLGLFLLRVAVVALLAAAVAEPAQLLPVPPARGQVLLAPGLTRAELAPLRPALDSLRQQGYQLRQLHGRLPLGAPLAWTSLGLGDTTTAARFQPDTVPSANLWQLVRAAADSVPGRPLVVAAPLALSSFTGSRPPLPAAVRWLPVPPPDSVRWVVSAWQTQPDSLVALVATSQETGTRFQKIRQAWPAANGSVRIGGVAAQFDAQQQALRQGVRRIPLYTHAPRWHVSSDADHAASARVLLAALRAVGSVLPVSPRITNGATLPPDSLDWLFWLQNAPTPAHLPRTQVWEEARTATSVRTAFQPVGTPRPIPLLRLDTTRLRNGFPHWLTASGQPLLSRRSPSHWYLHTRLATGWSELADSPALPTLLLTLLNPPATNQPDIRQLPASQLTAPRLAAVSGVAPTAPRRPLAPWLVLAAGILFAAERLWASRRAAVSPSTATA
ncbi:BatA domain-containing protein [Hymenobacter pini]|uniref:BatA domain-containing protein n=1 Tax=Hymenobacter pini TaxID=2880879 RepID=UPI001CF0E143|nr:BatA domain-containing protein [Hymenobacter pini]MCA8832356.1 BatA domain-containing protein [Hymenobacter pini]